MLGIPDLLVSPTLARMVIPLARSRTKTSLTPLVSFATRSDAALSNTSDRPSGVIVGLEEGPLPEWIPSVLTLTSLVVPCKVSRRNTSVVLLVSARAKLAATLSKATNWPLDETVGKFELPSPPPIPEEFTLTRAVRWFL